MWSLPANFGCMPEGRARPQDMEENWHLWNVNSRWKAQLRKKKTLGVNNQTEITLKRSVSLHHSCEFVFGHHQICTQQLHSFHEACKQCKL